MGAWSSAVSLCEACRNTNMRRTRVILVQLDCLPMDNDDCYNRVQWERSTVYDCLICSTVVNFALMSATNLLFVF